jgi:hypothetical protein
VRKRSLTAALAAATVIALTACTPPPNDEDTLPGSGTAPKGSVAQAVDTDSIAPVAGPLPKCEEVAAAVGSIIDGMQPKPSNFEKRGYVSGLEALTCNWVNPEFIAKSDEGVWVSVQVTAAKINPEAYAANNEGVAALAIAGSPAEALGGASYGVADKLATTDTLTKDGVITVGNGVTVVTAVTASEGVTSVPTVADALTGHASILTQVK